MIGGVLPDSPGCPDHLPCRSYIGDSFFRRVADSPLRLRRISRNIYIPRDNRVAGVHIRFRDLTTATGETPGIDAEFLTYPSSAPEEILFTVQVQNRGQHRVNEARFSRGAASASRARLCRCGAMTDWGRECSNAPGAESRTRADR